MTEQLHTRLADLAGDAATAAPVEPAGLWRAGKRRQRRRTAAAGLVACAVVLAGVSGAGVFVERGHHDPAPVAPQRSDLHLPDHIYKPSPWSEGTADLGEIGPLAAIASAPRYSPVGWSGKREEPAALFGVSAVDRTVRFLDLGLGETYRQPWDGPTTALSPDGTKIGFQLDRLSEAGNENSPTETVGWGIYDALTGDLSILQDPAAKAVTPHLGDLTFTADSRWLVTNYAPGASVRSNKADSLVLWNVETGRRVVADGPGKYWQPNIGSAPAGLLWSDVREVHRFDPTTGQRADFTVPKAVVYASVGPDDRAFAYIGGGYPPGPDGGIDGDTWRLYVGPDRQHMRKVAATSGELGYVVGWRDPYHVVISGWSGPVLTVDVRSGTVQRSRMIDGNGMASVAGDFVANATVHGVRPPAVHEPRRAAHLVVYVGLPLSLLGLVLWRRREQR